MFKTWWKAFYVHCWNLPHASIELRWHSQWQLFSLVECVSRNYSLSTWAYYETGCISVAILNVLMFCMSPRHAFKPTKIISRLATNIISFDRAFIGLSFLRHLISFWWRHTTRRTLHSALLLPSALCVLTHWRTHARMLLLCVAYVQAKKRTSTRAYLIVYRWCEFARITFVRHHP